ncbi:MAG TPA: CHASE3 domain-containing protein [Burkholderiaceae bacterium]
MKYPSKSTASILGAGTMLVAVIAVLFWSFLQITQAAAERQHINQELDSANELLSSLKDAETGYRGFLLTGDETYLEPYLLVRDSIAGQLQTLRGNTLIPAAQQRLDAMMPLVDAELAETARVIELRRLADSSAIDAAFTIGTGKRLMDSLRAETSAFLTIEKIALTQREESFQSKIRVMFGIIVVASLLAGLLGVWFGFLKHQDAKHQLGNLIHAETQVFLVALQKTNEELEAARQDAVNANNAKSDFLSSMSHELRTPLNAILGFAQLMETDSPPPSKPQRESIKQIVDAGWYLLKLVNEVLDLAQVESGNVVLFKEEVSLGELMQDCHLMIEPQATQQAIGLAFPQFSSPIYVHADRTRLKQCLINLLSNAIKYNRPNGEVSVECVITDPDKVRIAIRDTGAGLAAEQIDRLFEAFNRLGQEFGVAEGSGIGLVVTKRLVELMGGTIGVQSTVGEGSVFCIELTQAAAPAPEPELEQPGHLTALPQTVAADSTSSRTVLYVEDNPANLMLVQHLVARRPDLRLLCAGTAKEGMASARTHLPGVILMDINLPGISGIEAMKMLRADPLTSHIPVIAVSANAMAHDIEEALEAGFFQYLTKPIQLKELMNALDAALKFSDSNPINAAVTEPV